MPERHHVEEDPFFRVTMLAFAVLMPVLAIVLYVVTAIQPPVWITAAVVSSVLSLVAGRYLDRSRVVRIGMRTLYILIPILLIVLSILLIVLTGAGLEGMEIPASEFWMYANAYLQILLNTGLLFMLPVMAFSARHGRTFDVVAMRVYAVAVLVLSLFLCFYRAEGIGVRFLLDSPYAGAAFCLCAAVLVVCSFGCHPPKNWPFKKQYEKWRKAIPGRCVPFRMERGTSMLKRRRNPPPALRRPEGPFRLKYTIPVLTERCRRMRTEAVPRDIAVHSAAPFSEPLRLLQPGLRVAEEVEQGRGKERIVPRDVVGNQKRGLGWIHPLVPRRVPPGGQLPRLPRRYARARPSPPAGTNIREQRTGRRDFWG